MNKLERIYTHPISSIAWGDESALTIVKPGRYFLGATIVEPNMDQQLKDFRVSKPQGAAKLHWRNMTDKQKEMSVSCISRICQTTIIISASPLLPANSERARSKCLELLLFELESKGVDLLVLESRNKDLDKRDLDGLFYSQRKGIISKIDMMHVQGKDDYHLWLPDQILGAYGETKRGNADRKWFPAWEVIRQRVVEKEIRI